MKVELGGIHAVRVKYRGSDYTYYYAWRGGPRIKAEPGTPEFHRLYNEAIGKEKRPAKGNVSELIALFRGSTEFRVDISERTRADYTRILLEIEIKFGSLPKAALESRPVRGVFKRWRDKQAENSIRQADYKWSVLQRVFSVAKDRGEIGTNPCERGGRLYDSNRADKIWSNAQIASFLAAAPAHLHLPLMLALWTGQREGDLIRLPWSAYDGKFIRLRQSKTGRYVTIPVGAPLRSMLDDAKRKGPLVLYSAKGAWTSGGFGASWRKACRKAGIPVGRKVKNAITFHDLRGTAVTRLALAECTTAEIATITGHSLKDVQTILDRHYLSRDVALAESAIVKLESWDRKSLAALSSR